MKGEAWFEDPDQPVSDLGDQPESFVLSMVEQEVARESRTVLTEGTPQAKAVPEIFANEVIADAIAKKPIIHRSDRTGTYIITLYDVALFDAAARAAYIAHATSRVRLRRAFTEGKLAAKVLAETTEGSKLGLYFMAAARSWSPDMLARQLLVEDCIAAGMLEAAQEAHAPDPDRLDS